MPYVIQLVLHGTTRRAPGGVCASQAAGTDRTEQVQMIRSYGAPAAYPWAPSPVITVGVWPRAFRPARAVSASSGSTSTLTTRPAPSRWDRRAAWKPVPVPISRTRCPSASAASASMRSTVLGAEAEEVGSWKPSSSSAICVTTGTSRYAASAQRTGSVARSQGT